MLYSEYIDYNCSEGCVMSLLEIVNGMHDEWCVLCIIPPCFCALQGTNAPSLFILIDKRKPLPEYIY